MLLNIPQHTALLSTAKNMPIVLGCLSLGTCPVIRARFLILSPVYALCHWNNSMIWNKLLDTRWPREMSFSEMVTYGIARDKILLWMDRALAESPGQPSEERVKGLYVQTTLGDCPLIYYLLDQCWIHLHPSHRTDLPTHLPQSQLMTVPIVNQRGMPLCWFPR